MPELPAQCPITGGPVIVTRFYSPDGDVTFDGRFEVKSPFLALDRNQIEFVLTFIQCEGKFNRMQEELNLSYPTLSPASRKSSRPWDSRRRPAPTGSMPNRTAWTYWPRCNPAG